MEQSYCTAGNAKDAFKWSLQHCSRHHLLSRSAFPTEASPNPFVHLPSRALLLTFDGDADSTTTKKLTKDCAVPSQLTNESDFGRRFRMPREVFNCIMECIIGHDCFYDQVDMFANPTIRPLVRLMACLLHLAYGSAAERGRWNLLHLDTVVNDSTNGFCRLMKHSVGKEYLCRLPTAQERQRILSINAGRDFPVMFASWDCKHNPMPWRNQKNLWS